MYTAAVPKENVRKEGLEFQSQMLVCGCHFSEEDVNRTVDSGAILFSRLGHCQVGKF
jgi:hypothetical protein